LILEHDYRLGIQPPAARIQIIGADDRKPAVKYGILGMDGPFGLLGRILPASLPFPDLNAAIRAGSHAGFIIDRQHVVIVVPPHDGQHGKIVGDGAVGQDDNLHASARGILDRLDKSL